MPEPARKTCGDFKPHPTYRTDINAKSQVLYETFSFLGLSM